jgi:hypothetical protein
LDAKRENETSFDTQPSGSPSDAEALTSELEESLGPIQRDSAANQILESNLPRRESAAKTLTEAIRAGQAQRSFAQKILVEAAEAHKARQEATTRTLIEAIRAGQAQRSFAQKILFEAAEAHKARHEDATKPFRAVRSQSIAQKILAEASARNGPQRRARGTPQSIARYVYQGAGRLVDLPAATSKGKLDRYRSEGATISDHWESVGEYLWTALGQAGEESDETMHNDQSQS